LQRRVETLNCILFAAYKVFKELELQLKKVKSALFPEKAIEIAKTVYQFKAQTGSLKKPGS
jgi:hypothetical protein